MYNVLLTLLVIISILIIIAVMMQPAKNDNASNPRGFCLLNNSLEPPERAVEAFMQKVTTILGILFFVIGLALVYLSSH